MDHLVQMVIILIGASLNLIMKTWTHEQSLWKEDAYEQSRGDYTQEERNEQRTVSTVPVRMESINISPY